MPERQLYPTAEFPSLHATNGRTPGTPVPLRWLQALVNEAVLRITAAGGTATTPTDQARMQREVDSAVIYGFDGPGIRIGYQDELTEVEELRDRVVAFEQRNQALRELLHADGTLVADAAEKLKKLLG